MGKNSTTIHLILNHAIRRLILLFVKAMNSNTSCCSSGVAQFVSKLIESKLLASIQVKEGRRERIRSAAKDTPESSAVVHQHDNYGFSKPVYKPIDVVRVYSKFNQLLFKAMQEKESVIQKIFSKTFIGQEKAKELHEFSRTSRLPPLMKDATARSTYATACIVVAGQRL